MKERFNVVLTAAAIVTIIAGVCASAWCIAEGRNPALAAWAIAAAFWAGMTAAALEDQ